jgi:hypothetical protein
VERVIPQMKATFPLWSTICLSACYLLAYPNPAFINVRLPLTTKTTTVVGVPPSGQTRHAPGTSQSILFLFFLPFSDRFIYHFFSFLSSSLVLYPVHCGAPFCFLSIAGISNWRPGVGHKSPLFFPPLSHQISFDFDKSGTSAISCCWPPRQYLVHYRTYLFFSFVCFLLIGTG